MLDAFFWYTGFVFWILVAAGAACFAAADASGSQRQAAALRTAMISSKPSAGWSRSGLMQSEGNHVQS